MVYLRSSRIRDTMTTWPMRGLRQYLTRKVMIMATFTIEQDKATRAHLATLARDMRTKFANTAYQGDYTDTVTGDTFGDRLQVGTTATVDGIRYLLVANVLVSRKSGGKVSVRVSAWSLSGNTGEVAGTWVIRRTDLTGVRLTPSGFVRRIGNRSASVDMAQRVATYLGQARALLNDGYYGRPVVTIHTDRDGDNPYDTIESHLLPFGGTEGVYKRLKK